jgi:hypothetical protein
VESFRKNNKLFDLGYLGSHCVEGCTADRNTAAAAYPYLHAVTAGEDVVNEVVREQDVSGPLESLRLVPLHPEHLWSRETCRLLTIQDACRRLGEGVEGTSVVKKGYLFGRCNSKKQYPTSV